MSLSFLKYEMRVIMFHLQGYYKIIHTVHIGCLVHILDAQFGKKTILICLLVCGCEPQKLKERNV